MAFTGFSFAPPTAPAPSYIPDFRAFREVGVSFLPGFPGDEVKVPYETGKQLLDGCLERNWVLTDHLIRLLEAAWHTKQAQEDVKRAVNTQDEVSLLVPWWTVTLLTWHEIYSTDHWSYSDSHMRQREQVGFRGKAFKSWSGPQHPHQGTVVFPLLFCVPRFVNICCSFQDGSTALHFAAAYLKEDMVRLLITVGSDASMQGGVRIEKWWFRWCLKLSWPVVFFQPLNQLPLQVACSRKHGAFPVVQYLVYLSGEDARLMEDVVHGEH